MSEIVGIEHVAIAVRNGPDAIKHFENLGLEADRIEDVAGGMRSHIMKAGSAHIEILSSTSGDSLLEAFLEKHGEGLHHVCLRVRSLDTMRSTAADASCIFVNDEPTADEVGQRVFIHPRSNHGVLMGLVEPHRDAVARYIDPGWTSYIDKTFAPAVGKRGEVIAISGLNSLDEQGRIQAPDDIVGQCRAFIRSSALCWPKRARDRRM
jgi:methylmalonyl-CoA/ethylmalonyl-CoA epimerase